MVKVIVPNPQYRGVIAEVQFHNGVAHFENEKLAEQIAKQFGFEIVKDQVEIKEEPVEVKTEKQSAPKKRKKAGE